MQLLGKGEDGLYLTFPFNSIYNEFYTSLKREKNLFLKLHPRDSTLCTTLAQL